MDGIRKVLEKIKAYGTLVMFSHTIFSFSFALIALLLASQGKPEPSVFFWALLALLGARTGANALNRVIDAKIDKRNKRTAGRQIPKGEIKAGEAALFTAICFFLVVVSAWQLNPLCFYLSPAAVFFLVFYSYTKRFTWLCHMVLGITCGIAPVGAWLAVTGSFGLAPFLLGAINCLWTAGFDIIYSTQDYDFDQACGLFSIPVRFGIKGGLRISAWLHALALLLLGVFIYREMPVMGSIMWLGFGIIAALLVLQHALVGPDHLKHVPLASYSISQITSLVLLAAGVLDIYL